MCHQILHVLLWVTYWYYHWKMCLCCYYGKKDLSTLLLWVRDKVYRLYTQKRVKCVANWYFMQFVEKKTRMWLNISYTVPATRVLTWVTLSGKSFASPKSPILGSKLPSRSTLLAFMSLWTICGSASSWRNARPDAVPLHIWARVAQSRSRCLPLEPIIEPNRIRKLGVVSFHLMDSRKT